METLIPDSLFDDRAKWLLLLIAAIAVAFLIKGADMLVEGASGIAYRFGLSKVVVGATIVSLGTTSPECAVSVTAAWAGNPGLALGNAVGSIVADTALIFGLGCVLVVLPADKFVLTRQGWAQFGSAVLLAALCYLSYVLSPEDAALGRWAGILLIVLLGVYMYMSVRWSREHPENEPFSQHPDMAGTPMTASVEVDPGRHAAWRLVSTGVIGLLVVLFASRVMVGTMDEFATQVGVPEVIIAATLVALGTSLPELVVGMASIYKGHRELLVGNVIGADVLNVLFVVGAAAAFSPKALPLVDTTGPEPSYIFLTLLLPVMLGILLLFRVLIFRAVAKGEFSRWMGIPLLLLYAVFVLLQVKLGISH